MNFHPVIRHLARPLAWLGSQACAMSRDRDANVTLLAALSLIPTLFGMGFCIDYARAQMLKSRIDAVADAAALTAADQLYIQQSASVAQAAASQIFNAQVTDYRDFNYNPSTQLVVTITDAGGINLGRTAYVHRLCDPGAQCEFFPRHGSLSVDALADDINGDQRS